MVTGTRIAGGEGGRWLNEGVRRIVNYGWLASIEVGELAGTDKSLEAQRVSEKLEWYLIYPKIVLVSLLANVSANRPDPDIGSILRLASA